MQRRLLWVVPLLIGLGMACSDSTGVTQTDLVGSWNATEFVFSDFGDPVTDFDVLAGGGAVKFTFGADGSFTIVFTMPMSAPDTTGGTWVLQGSNRLIITDEGAIDGSELQISLSGTTLTVYSDDVEFDFGAGDIPAQLDATFVKQ
ncbi:MAG: lipocalin family protein [Gemmatimonadota bacterium]|nr:lipocalin family protein [Gemmatimonadota bacterium]